MSAALARCELTHLPRVPVDAVLARVQHLRYEQALVGLGCDVRRLEPAPDLPDAVFVEDTAVVYPTSFPRTRERLEGRGIAVTAVGVSELQKAEGAVTCCSLVFEAAAGN